MRRSSATCSSGVFEMIPPSQYLIPVDLHPGGKLGGSAPLAMTWLALIVSVVLSKLTNAPVQRLTAPREKLDVASVDQVEVHQLVERRAKGSVS